MPLLSDADRTTLVQHLAPIGKPVDLLLFTQTFGGSESGPLAKQVLDEVASLHDKITVVEKNFVLDTEDRAKYGVDKSPAIVVLSDGAGHADAALRRAHRLRVRLAGRGRAARRHRHAGARARDARPRSPR